MNATSNGAINISKEIKKDESLAISGRRRSSTLFTTLLVAPGLLFRFPPPPLVVHFEVNAKRGPGFTGITGICVSSLMRVVRYVRAVAMAIKDDRETRNV